MHDKQDRTVTIGAYTFDEVNHVHTLDGKPLIGVTTVLKVIGKGDALIQWAANEAVKFISLLWNPGVAYDEEVIEAILEQAKYAHKKVKESAGEFGSEVHNAIERYIKTGEMYVTAQKNQQKAFDNFVQWAEDNKVKFLESEKHLYSRKMWVGGICDIVCEIDGKRYVGDVKTSSGIYPEHFIQCSTYAEMLKEMGLYDRFDGVVVINCNKKGGFDYKFNYDLQGNLECFKAALTIYKQLNAIK